MLPNCGEANFLPPKSLAELIPESFLTTNEVPPLDTPEIIRNSSVPESINPSITELGPTYAASTWPEYNASTTDGPELKTRGFIVNLPCSSALFNALLKFPVPIPIIA